MNTSLPLLLSLTITQIIAHTITVLNIGDKTYEQCVEACERIGTELATKQEILDYLSSAFQGDVWTPIGEDYNNWLQIGSRWPYGELHTEIDNGIYGKPDWGTEQTAQPFKQTFYCVDSTGSYAESKSTQNQVDSVRYIVGIILITISVIISGAALYLSCSRKKVNNSELDNVSKINKIQMTKKFDNDLVAEINKTNIDIGNKDNNGDEDIVQGINATAVIHDGENNKNEGIGTNNRNEEIKQWFKNETILNENVSEIYFNIFIENGLDNLQIIKMMTDHDLRDINIDKLGHRRALLAAIKNM